MTTQALIPRLQKSFQRCAPLDAADMVRCERAYEGRSRSVYFFRSMPSLPDERELARIHQDVVSPSYFEAQDASRWNHYVIFVASDGSRNSQDFRKRQREIEEDRKYARKLVVLESELDAFLDHSVLRPRTDSTMDAVVRLWTSKLVAAGLASVTSAAARAPIIRAVRDGDATSVTENLHSVPRALSSTSQSETATSASLWVKRFELERFGSRRIRGNFDFARVNLIRGPNGAGKTSLLEAIEHFFCGATFRSGGEPEQLDASITFANRSEPVRYRQREPSHYQERDLRWYGRNVNRKNRLCDGFSRYNFLNTDAAVHLASDDNLQDLTEALSKITLGPEAAYIWDRIGEFERDFRAELPRTDATLSHATETLENANERLNALQTASPQTEANVARVNAALRSLRWPEAAALVAEPKVEWYAQFEPLRAFLEARDSTSQIASEKAAVEAIKSSEAELALVSELMETSRVLREQDVALRRRIESRAERGARLPRLEQYLRSELPVLLETQTKATEKQAQLLRRLVSPQDCETLESLAEDAAALPMPLADFEKSLRAELNTLRRKLESDQLERAEIETQLRTTEKIVADIHALGRQFAHAEPHGDACPLCHTPMRIPELLSRIEQSVGRTNATRELDELATAIAKGTERVQAMTSACLTVERLADRSPGAERMSIDDLLRQAWNDQVAYKDLAATLSVLTNQLWTLQSAGFNIDEYARLTSYFQAQLDILPGALDLAAVSSLIEEYKAGTRALQEEEQSLAKSNGTLTDQCAQLRRRYPTSTGELADIRAVVEALIAGQRRLLDTFKALPAQLRETLSDNLECLETKGRQALKAIDDLSAQIQAERARNNEIAVLQKQIAADQVTQLKARQARDRVSKALAALQDLQEHHSLESGMSQFFTDHLESIQGVFSKIHVPHELRLSSLKECLLERTGSSSEPVGLNQVSTGQRAALMLSVFITLNLSLQGGPPLMLIDDPIAHIDDLNALSFLDFLGDVAESGDRQIFFATANEKLANLFEKKMEFLGPERTVHNLTAQVR